MLNILSIGGSDPSSGAGIQGDIKSCESLNAYCLTVITGITSQNTAKFGTVEPVSLKMLREQLDMMSSDFKIDGIKIGMVYSPGIVKIISDSLRKWNVPVVLDPVIKSTTGGMLIKKQTVPHLKRHLVPASTIITPNKFEAEFLTGSKIRSKKSVEKAAKKIQNMGVENIVITGLELEQNQMTDYILTGNRQYYTSGKKINQINHGGGCNFSLALCYALACKMPTRNAVLFSKKFTHDSIRNSTLVGSGVRVTHSSNGGQIYDQLLQGIEEFRQIKGISTHIPECQTNFVFSKARPISTQDVLGVEGRLVRTGSRVVMAGDLKYGGSKHVASAVVAACKKFPSLRSAVNIKFQKDTLAKLKSQLTVLEYDRTVEPARIKTAEGHSIVWGISAAMNDSKVQPDAIFHEGDFGKESMIIIFGENPSVVTEKLRNAL